MRSSFALSQNSSSSTVQNARSTCSARAKTRPEYRLPSLCYMIKRINEVIRSKRSYLNYPTFRNVMIFARSATWALVTIILLWMMNPLPFQLLWFLTQGRFLSQIAASLLTLTQQFIRIIFICMCSKSSGKRGTTFKDGEGSGSREYDLCSPMRGFMLFNSNGKDSPD